MVHASRNLFAEKDTHTSDTDGIQSAFVGGVMGAFIGGLPTLC